jgi:hypothetical protein
MLYDAGLNLLPSLEKDVVFGLNNEPIVIDKLTKYFNEPIEKTKDKYCRYDAVSSTTKYEIKSRRCLYSTYSTTILPVHKIVEKDDSRLVLVFHFTDGLFYIVYKKELFDTFETKHITYYRSGGLNSPVLHFMIPTKELTKIEI